MSAATPKPIASPPKPVISILVAMDENGVIGRDGDLPWRLPADLRRVKALTTGNTIIMGRKTFDSIGRPLPNRRSIVISRDRSLRIEGAEVVHSLEAALARAQADDEIFVFGGAEIFRLALPLAHRLYLTRVHAQVDGDVHFPSWRPEAWEQIEDQSHPADERHDFPYSFQTWRRARATTV